LNKTRIKKIFEIKTLGSLIPALFLILTYGQCPADNLSMVVNTWPPYASRDLPDNGLAVELVRTALQRKGHQINLHYETWPRALEGLEIGIFDIVGAVWKTKEREKQILFSEPYLINQVKFLKRKKDTIKFTNLEDLTGYFIGIVKDYAYQDEFVNSRRHIKLPQNHIIQNLQRLLQGDIDLTLGDERAIVYEIKKYMPNRMKELEFLDKPLSRRPLYIGVSRQNPQAEKIISEFNQAIEKMRQDGSYQRIVQKFTYPLNQDKR